jgi:large subunit ribosomal protein L18
MSSKPDELFRRRRQRVRFKLRQAAKGRVRLSVFRSSRHIYAQIIDDLNGKTLASASSREKVTAEGAGKVSLSAAVGKLLAERAKAQGVSQVCFDRGGYLYHGRVKALADGARAAGLEF